MKQSSFDATDSALRILAFAAVLAAFLVIVFGARAAFAQEPATLTITKECTTPDPEATFTIFLTGPEQESVDLGCGESESFTIVGATPYVVSEAVPPGWAEPSIRGACDGDGSVMLDAGATGTCVVSNTLLEDETADLTVTKECTTASDATFTVYVSGPDEQSADIGCGDSETFEIVADAPYIVSEDVPDGWDEPSIRGACDGDGSVILGPGESGTCVITNTLLEEDETADLTVTKECTTASDATFTVYVSGPDEQSADIGCGDSETFEIVADAGYIVSEDVPDGWDEPSIRGACDGDGSVILGPGESGTCVITNTLLEEDTADLTITKECTTASDATFTVYVSGPDEQSADISCGDSETFEIVADAGYIVSEDFPDGWDEPSIRGACDGDGSIILGPGESGTCVITNTLLEDETADLTVTKECTTASDATFTVYVSGPDEQSAGLGCGDSETFEIVADAGYIVSEDVPDGWDEPSIRGACDGDGSVILASGESGTCVITNTLLEDDLATLTVTKECATLDSETVFTIYVDGPYDDGSVDLRCGESEDFLVVADTEYRVTETPPAGYDTPSFRGLCDGDGTFILGPGESGTCVVRNTMLEEDTATLTLTKECAAPDAGTVFTIYVDGPYDDGSVDLRCGESETFIVAAWTEYWVSETPPAGYAPPSFRGICDGDGSLALEGGASGTCVIHNAKLAVPPEARPQAPQAPVEPTPTPRPPTSRIITPPNTGDAGLVGASTESRLELPVLLGAIVAAVSGLVLIRVARRGLK